MFLVALGFDVNRLQLVLLEFFDVAVDLVELFGDVDALRAVGGALATADAA